MSGWAVDFQRMLIVHMHHCLRTACCSGVGREGMPEQLTLLWWYGCAASRLYVLALFSNAALSRRCWASRFSEFFTEGL